MKTVRNMQCLANHNPLHVASLFLPCQYNVKLNKDARLQPTINTIHLQQTYTSDLCGHFFIDIQVRYSYTIGRLHDFDSISCQWYLKLSEVEIPKYAKNTQPNNRFSCSSFSRQDVRCHMGFLLQGLSVGGHP